MAFKVSPPVITYTDLFIEHESIISSQASSDRRRSIVFRICCPLFQHLSGNGSNIGTVQLYPIRSSRIYLTRSQAVYQPHILENGRHCQQVYRVRHTILVRHGHKIINSVRTHVDNVIDYPRCGWFSSCTITFQPNRCTA